MSGQFRPKYVIKYIIIINIKDWAIWPVPSPELQRSRQCFFGLPIVLFPCGLQWYDFKEIRCCGILCRCISQSLLYSSILSSMHSVCSSRRMESFFFWSLTVWPARGLNKFISAASILRLCEAVKVKFSDPYKSIGKTKVLCNFKIFSVLTFLKIVLLIVPITVNPRVTTGLTYEQLGLRPKF
jgi:hypothetical protein